MKRFKTVKPLICISLVLVVVVSIVLIVGRYIVLNNITETTSEIQLAKNEKKSDEFYGRYKQLLQARVEE